MTFLAQLQAHKGGLLRLKGKLFWYGGRGWDRSPGRVCLILDAARTTAARAAARAAHAAGATAAARTAAADAYRRSVAALLLIDDRPQWVQVSQQDVEIL